MSDDERQVIRDEHIELAHQHIKSVQMWLRTARKFVALGRQRLYQRRMVERLAVADNARDRREKHWKLMEKTNQ